MVELQSPGTRFLTSDEVRLRFQERYGHSLDLLDDTQMQQVIEYVNDLAVAELQEALKERKRLALKAQMTVKTKHARLMQATRRRMENSKAMEQQEHQTARIQENAIEWDSYLNRAETVMSIASNIGTGSGAEPIRPPKGKFFDDVADDSFSSSSELNVEDMLLDASWDG